MPQSLKLHTPFLSMPEGATLTKAPTSLLFFFELCVFMLFKVTLLSGRGASPYTGDKLQGASATLSIEVLEQLESHWNVLTFSLMPFF